MRNRFENAVFIQQGACNPSGIAHSIVQACQEARKECGDTAYLTSDPAIRLMVHQLAFICKVDEINNEFLTYNTLTELCEQKAGE